MGCPVGRDRIYILLIRTDLCVEGARDDFHAFATEMIGKIEWPQCNDWLLTCKHIPNQTKHHNADAGKPVQKLW